MPEQKNPTQLKSAVVFGLLYAAVLLALAVAKYFWQRPRAVRRGLLLRPDGDGRHHALDGADGR